MEVSVLKIDKAILDTNSVICRNIVNYGNLDRGFLSQNVLAQLRNFVEYIVLKVCSTDENVDPNSYNERTKLLKQISGRGDLKFLYSFHQLLQISVSHYTFDSNISERLMLNFYEFLLRIKFFLAKKYDLLVLEKIKDFPIFLDKGSKEYYQKITEKINNSSNMNYIGCNERYYVKKIKPFIVDENIYYEVTFTIAFDNASKFDRLIAFTTKEILDNYAVKLKIRKEEIVILNTKIEILIIDDWKVSIRPCEMKLLGYIFMGNKDLKSNNLFFENLMTFITNSKMDLISLMDSDDDFYNSAMNDISSRSRNTSLLKIFDTCREIIKGMKPGANVLRYLLFTMNNAILKDQMKYNGECDLLSNLHLNVKCVPFDQMPFASSLVNHNPKIFDLEHCIPIKNRDYEFLARYLKTNTEENGVLFTQIKELENFDGINTLVEKYNSKLYEKHKSKRMIKYFSDDYLYISEYAEDCSFIIKRLIELSSSGIKNYSSIITQWLDANSKIIDDDLKRNALLNMFYLSKVAMIYGSAGTGKTKLISYVSDFLKAKKKLYLANTNPAVENLIRRVKTDNCQYMTIAKFLGQPKSNEEYDVLFIDECSTISNSSMREVLEKAKFNLLVLVGDECQIEAIQFGNWFSIAKYFIPNTSIFELVNTFRSTDEKLRKVWNSVRNIQADMQVLFDINGYSKQLDDTIFEKNEDEIVLCLNYDGLYGVNNINYIMQNNNKNKSVKYGLYIYKIEDPVLFNEKSKKYSSSFHNNMKGIIRAIEESEEQIRFDIEIELVSDEFDESMGNVQLIKNKVCGNSIVRIIVNKIIDTDEDNANLGVPFQVSYAVSIHKAQGLEYNSVKIIISNEVEERISHNIFYTAITRAKKNLSVYWSPEVEKKVFLNLKKNDYLKDAKILKEIYPSLAVAIR